MRRRAVRIALGGFSFHLIEGLASLEEGIVYIGSQFYLPGATDFSGAAIDYIFTAGMSW